MTREIGCSELGIKNCDWVARGETDEDVVRQIVAHLWEEHHLDVPHASVIMGDKRLDKSVFGNDHHEEVITVIRRLREVLDIEPYEESLHAKPLIGRYPNA